MTNDEIKMLQVHKETPRKSDTLKQKNSFRVKLSSAGGVKGTVRITKNNINNNRRGGAVQDDINQDNNSSGSPE